LIPLLMAAALTVTATAVLAFPTAAQNELDRCLRHNRIPSGKVRMVVQARLPWTFGDESGCPVFGDSWCFHTNVRYSHTTGAYPTPVLQKVFALVKKRIPALNAESGAFRVQKKPSCF